MNPPINFLISKMLQSTVLSSVVHQFDPILLWKYLLVVLSNSTKNEWKTARRSSNEEIKRKEGNRREIWWGSFFFYNFGGKPAMFVLPWLTPLTNLGWGRSFGDGGWAATCPAYIFGDRGRLPGVIRNWISRITLNLSSLKAIFWLSL